jgi:hypothetical protein
MAKAQFSLSDMLIVVAAIACFCTTTFVADAVEYEAIPVMGYPRKSDWEELKQFGHRKPVIYERSTAFGFPLTFLRKYDVVRSVDAENYRVVDEPLGTIYATNSTTFSKLSIICNALVFSTVAVLAIVCRRLVMR